MNVYARLLMTLALFGPGMALAERAAAVGQTEILKWPQGKKTAVSITYDGGTINQFRVALPIMNELGFRASFFIVTGEIQGSRHPIGFRGRPLEDIIAETATVPLDERNFLERATAVHFLPYAGAAAYHTRAGDLFETKKFSEARAQVEEAYAKVRAGELKPLDGPRTNDTVHVSWAELRKIAAQGHEFASHSISHPQFAICDDANLAWQLEQSKAELAEQLGPKHTFSHECPHGSENPRVMAAAMKTYPALRNRMPEPFLHEINRWNKTDPAASTREYVQWQRGPKTSTPPAEMKSWIETCLTRDNIWLVLVLHGIDGIGWQPKTGQEIKDYFTFIKANEDQVWVATFQDATKYIRQRMNATVRTSRAGDAIQVALSHSLDASLYQLPLTLQTRVPVEWKMATVRQGNKTRLLQVGRDAQGAFVRYEATPHAGLVELSQGGLAP